MSAASKSLKLTVSLITSSSLVVVLITLFFFKHSITHSEHDAIEYAREVILEAGAEEPDWNKIMKYKAYQQLTIHDLEADKPLIQYTSSETAPDFILKLQQALRPAIEPQVIHGYKLALKVNHLPLLNTGLQILALAIFSTLLSGLLTGLLNFRSMKRQSTLDAKFIEEAIQKLINKESDIQLNAKVSSEFKGIVRTLSQAEESLLTEISESRLHLESVERYAFYDALTNLGNKNLFKSELADLLQVGPTTHFGLLGILRGTALQQINDQSGYSAGDDYIKLLTSVVEDAAAHFKQFKLYRLSSSDIAIVIQFASKREYEKLGAQIENSCNDLARQLNLEEVANLGITIFQSGDDVSELLSRCDNALSIAATRSGNRWYFSEKPIEGPHQGRMQWRSLLSNIIEQSEVVLYSQPIMPLNDSTRVYSELQARFFDETSEPISTASILAQAQSSDLIIRLDKTIVGHALDLLKNSTTFGGNYAINLANSSIHNAHFCIWLERQLLRDPALSRRLVFEVSEHGLTSDIDAGRRLIDIIHRVGARFTIEHFGTSILSLKYFRELTPDYVKLDASHCAGIVEDKKLQYFIRTLVDITHQMGVKVIAEAVETVDQKQILETLNVDAIQGYFVGKPVPMVQSDDSKQEKNVPDKGSALSSN